MERTGLSDPEQLRFAAGEGGVFVTCNRNDFLHFTVEFFRKGESHLGILIVSRSLPSSRPERISHALQRWEQSSKNNPEGFEPYAVDFLS